MSCAFCEAEDARKHRRGWSQNSPQSGKLPARETVWACDACAEELDWL